MAVCMYKVLRSADGVVVIADWQSERVPIVLADYGYSSTCTRERLRAIPFGACRRPDGIFMTHSRENTICRRGSNVNYTSSRRLREDVNIYIYIYFTSGISLL